MFTTKWPAEHVDALRELVARGLSRQAIADQINQDLGTNYSRNAVIGKVARLKPTKAKRARKRSPSADDKIKIAARSNLPASYLERVEARPRMVCDAPPLAGDRSENGARDVALIELTGCRWPAGDGSAVPFTFCNAPKAFKGCAYCAEHRRMALRNAA